MLYTGKDIKPISLEYICDHCKQSILHQYPIQNYQTEEEIILNHTPFPKECEFENDNPIFKKYYHIILGCKEYDIHQECLIEFLKSVESDLKEGSRMVIDCMYERAYSIERI